MQDIPDYDSDHEATWPLQPASEVPAQHAPAADDASNEDAGAAEEAGQDSVSIMMRAFFASVGKEVREQFGDWQPESAPAEKGTPAGARARARAHARQRRGRIGTPGGTRGGPGRWYTTEVGPKLLGCHVKHAGTAWLCPAHALMHASSWCLCCMRVQP